MKEHLVPIQLVYLEDKASVHLIIEAKIGRKKVRMVIDTGAAHSCLNTASIDFTQWENNDLPNSFCGIGTETIEHSLITVPTFSIAAISLRNYPFLFFDISHINAQYTACHVEPVDGFLGSDLLERYKAVIDYPNRELRLYTKSIKKRTRK